ncbi:MAG: cupin domain protein, partial [Haloquadratum sp. J07HQX50]
EEAIYVLSGTGTIRLVDGAHALSAGDYVALPAGEADGHRVINDGGDDVPLRYLAISTMRDPDVVIYPDMDKVGVYTGTPPGRHEGRKLTKYYPEDANVDYWPDESEPD